MTMTRSVGQARSLDLRRRRQLVQPVMRREEGLVPAVLNKSRHVRDWIESPPPSIAEATGDAACLGQPGDDQVGGQPGFVSVDAGQIISLPSV